MDCRLCLLGYGTGAVMAVPGHDARDYAFANFFKNKYPEIAPIEVISGGDISKEVYEAKEGIVVNSDFINGMQVKDAMQTVIAKVEKMKIGERQINYRLRDAIFSRQRYWGEPFPVYYKDGIPYTLDENELPLVLPEVDKYLPTETGEPPLARAKNWQTKEGFPLETNTMPGFAGSSAYYLRYMDTKNKNELVSKEANEYWHNVDLYIGGAEHATGHLIYSRFWNKFLFDLGLVCKDEPFKKLINQGMIQGVSMLVNIAIINPDLSYILPTSWKINHFTFTATKYYVPVEYVEYTNGRYILTNEGLKKLLKDKPKYYSGTEIKIPTKENIEYWFNCLKINEKIPDFINENFVEMETLVEKMSKSKHNVINPDNLVEKYGADTLRLYEMFLGPLEQHKPWDTNGIEGVFRFIKKLWRLYHDKENKFFVSDEQPTKAEFKVLHKTIKKVQDDIERFSFNTSVSNFMICVNELSDLKCNKRTILQDLAILLSPYAPHIAEEFWHLLGNKESITYTKFPVFNEEYLVENNFEYPVSVNGKLRFKMELPLSLTNEEIEKEVLAKDELKKWLEGKQPKKIIIVQGKIVNIVV
jgi:leucyl-tRNA synthetase